MRPRFRAKLLAVALGGALIVPVMGIPAAAHQFEQSTSLSINRRPGGRVRAGTAVRFFGRLNSARPTCERNKLITLFRRGSGAVGRDLTNRSGDWSITRRVNRTGTYFARFNGTASGPHPHRHICFGSRSRDRTVPTR